MKKESEEIGLKDFVMLSLLGVGNYAKVLLVRRQGTNKVYAMKIVRKPKENGGVGVKKEHAFLERDLLVRGWLCRYQPRIPS